MRVVAVAIALLLGSATPAQADRGGHAIVLPSRGGQSHVLTDPREIGLELAAQRGWTGRLFTCLDTLWGVRESGWSVTAGYRPGYWHAYGVAQALPPSKYAVYGSDWRTSAWPQIRWGLAYIAARYGDPCRALAHSYAANFY